MTKTPQVVKTYVTAAELAALCASDDVASPLYYTLRGPLP